MDNPKVIVFSYFINPKYNFTQNIVDWYESMKKNYLTDCDRQFVIYTDNTEIRNIITDSCVQFIDVDPNTTLDVKENIHAKFRYIHDYLTKIGTQDFRYLAFIQSNARCVQRVSLSEIDNGDADLIVCKHIGAFAYGFSALYRNEKNSVVDIGDVDVSGFTYIHACHFLASRQIVIELCEYVNNSIECDRKNGIFTMWQDENYFNYYLNSVLLKRPDIKVNILDGRTYAHTWASWAWRVNKDPSFRIAVEMIDKKKPYANAVPVNQGENGKQKEQMDRKMI